MQCLADPMITTNEKISKQFLPDIPLDKILSGSSYATEKYKEKLKEIKVTFWDKSLSTTLTFLLQFHFPTLVEIY
jgi:hypothetical protein